MSTFTTIKTVPCFCMVFNDRHGYVKQQLFHHDGIHLSKKGTSIFLHNINTCATIMQKHGTVFIVVKVDITK
jgi:lysophospholipase L1-like esterase